VPEHNPGDFRIIHDFSFPHDNCLNSSVPRHTYLGECFVLALGMLDDISQEVLRLRSAGHRVNLWGRDLKSCFCQILECPSTWQYQCFHGSDGSLYFDLTAPMGAVPSTMKAMRLGTVPLHAHIHEGHFMILYIKNFNAVDAEEEAAASASSFDKKMDLLNFRFNLEEDPTSVKLVLRIEVDCDSLMLRLGAEKLKDTQELLLLWPRDRKLATLTELRSFAGKLLNICKVVPQSRPFISRVLEMIRCPQGSCCSGVVGLDETLQKDILWWKQFLPSCNGIKMIRSLDCGPTDSDFSMDASLEGVCASS
jgi:hypothetical protein